MERLMILIFGSVVFLLVGVIFILLSQMKPKTKWTKFVDRETLLIDSRRTKHDMHWYILRGFPEIPFCGTIEIGGADPMIRTVGGSLISIDRVLYYMVVEHPTIPKDVLIEKKPIR